MEARRKFLLVPTSSLQGFVSSQGLELNCFCYRAKSLLLSGHDPWLRAPWSHRPNTISLSAGEHKWSKWLFIFVSGLIIKPGMIIVIYTYIYFKIWQCLLKALHVLLTLTYVLWPWFWWECGISGLWVHISGKSGFVASDLNEVSCILSYI